MISNIIISDEAPIFWLLPARGYHLFYFFFCTISLFLFFLLVVVVNALFLRVHIYMPLLSHQAKERKCTLCGALGPRKPPRVRAARTRTGTDSTAFADPGFFSPPHAAMAKSLSGRSTPVRELRRSCQGEGGGEAQDQSAASAVVDGGELRPSCRGEGVRGESGSTAAAAVGDSSGGDWEG